MRSQTRLRILAGIPTLFSLIGIAIIGVAFTFRQVLPPATRILAGAVVVLACISAIVTLWRAHRSAIAAFVLSGTCAFAACLAVDRLFPLVNASDEPPPPLAQYYYPAALVAIAGLTLGGAWMAYAALHVRSNER